MKLLIGNEAIALGAIRAGVKLVAGYPGTPSTEILETVAKHNNDKKIYVEWSVNEKAAMELGAGAAYAGARTLVTMKQVGLNVASDPLMSLNYIGVKGGMVIVVADDPGPISSQTEQDTRHFGKFANIPVLDPTSPEEAYEMVQYAFEISEKFGTPVILRPTTKVCHSAACIEVDDKVYDYPVEGFVKDQRWVIFPPLAYRRHLVIEEQLPKIAEEFNNSGYNQIFGEGVLGVATSGISFKTVMEGADLSQLCVFKAATPFPFPEQIALEFLKRVRKVLVIEELDPVVEEALIELAYKNKIEIEILGKKTGHAPVAGEISAELFSLALEKAFGICSEQAKLEPLPALPMRAPSLCAGCPHRASFLAVKNTAPEGTIFTGDIGCYTLGNAKPLEMVDTCLCMGAGITIAQGLKRIQPDTKVCAFIGDSTFFHTGLPGVINAVYNGTDITVFVLDNSTTAMTGGQPHPGTGNTMMGSENRLDIEAILKACGVGYVANINPFDTHKAEAAAKEAIEYNGVSVVIYTAPCVLNKKKEARA